MDIPYLLYMLEQDGELDTPLGRRNKVIKILLSRACWEVLNEDIVLEEAAKENITDPAEITKIKIEVGVW